MIKKLAVIVIAFVFSSGLAGAQETVGAQGMKKSVLIAGAKSKFKDTVILKIISGIEKDAKVKTIELAKLDKEDARSYAAIVLVESSIGSQFEKTAADFIKNADGDTKKKTIVFTTWALIAWKPKGLGVDEISSASKMVNADTVADSIVQKVLKIIK